MSSSLVELSSFNHAQVCSFSFPAVTQFLGIRVVFKYVLDTFFHIGIVHSGTYFCLFECTQTQTRA